MPELIAPPPPPDAANIRVLSHEVQEIISRQPGWIVRNGMLLFLLIIGILFTATFFINYPDVITANAKLISVNAPKEVKVKSEGMLMKLLVREGQYVRQNDVIGFIESRAAHPEVIALSRTVDSLQKIAETNVEKLPGYVTASPANLGEIQPAYQIFMQAFTTFHQYLSSGFYIKKKRMLREDVIYLQRLHATLEEQLKIQQEDLHLARQTHDANQSLSSEKVISALEYREEQSKYLSKEMSKPQIMASLISNESSQHEKGKEMAQLDNEIAQQKSIFIQALNTLKAQLDDWKSRYLLSSPISGKVAFTGIVQERTYLKQGQVICFINPRNTAYYATLVIPQTNFGKVKIGERVLLRLPAYPYHEFGLLSGTLNFVSMIPTDSGFMAKVDLPDGLYTNYKKRLPYRDGLTAQAEIITEELKLSDRLFNELRSVLKNR